MTGISLSTTDTQFLLTIDKNIVSKDLINQLINRIRLEYLVEQADFDENIELLGEEIKSNWWQKNKKRLLGDNE